MRRAVLLALAVAIAVGGVFAGLVVTGAFGQNSSEKPEVKQTIGTISQDQGPADKQTLEAELATQQATNDARYAKAQLFTKGPDHFTPIPRPTSCPVDPSSVRSGIWSPPIYQLPSWSELSLLITVSEASGVSSSGAPYRVYSGSLRTEPHQGIVLVGTGDRDPCAEGKLDYSRQEYLTPAKDGTITLLEIDGDTVTFQTADGAIGRLNFITGQFQ